MYYPSKAEMKMQSVVDIRPSATKSTNAVMLSYQLVSRYQAPGLAIQLCQASHRQRIVTISVYYSTQVCIYIAILKAQIFANITVTGQIQDRI